MEVADDGPVGVGDDRCLGVLVDHEEPLRAPGAHHVRGTEAELISVVSVVSSTCTLITVAAGIALFGERSAPNQALGVAVVIAGLVILGLAG